MSPYPAQVDQASIVEKARELIEQDGADNLTLAKLAAAFNIKAPSLYKHIASRAQLLKAVNTVTAHRLKSVMDGVRDAGLNRRETLYAVSNAYRAFALANPASYMLLYANLAVDARPDKQLMESIAIPLQQLVGTEIPAGYSLEALRGALALLHGFVTLELNGQFQRGGDLEQAFQGSIRAYFNGWANQPESSK